MCAEKRPVEKNNLLSKSYDVQIKLLAAEKIKIFFRHFR